MFLSREIATFSVTTGKGRKYLRVSNPKGEQQCTYFLQIPYIYGIPLLIGSGLMHWLVSQSIFLANITIIPRDGLVPMQDEITTIAYSPVAMLFLLFLGVCMLLFLLVVALRKLPRGMPLIASNSIAISAACHLPGYDQSELEEVPLHPLTWGAVPNNGKTPDLGIISTTTTGDTRSLGYHDDDDANKGIGHCCFSDKVLEWPERGKLYS
jgi:hypothetical protein